MFRSALAAQRQSFSSAQASSRTTHPLVGAAVVGSEAVAAFTVVGFAEVASVAVGCMPAASTAAATEAACVRHIPSLAAQGVPDIQLPVVLVVPVTQSRVAPVVR